MNVHSITIRPDRSDYFYDQGGIAEINLNVVSPKLSDSYIIKALSGLEPPILDNTRLERKLENNFGAMAPRNIDILLALNIANSEGLTIEQLRTNLYNILYSPGEGKLTVFLLDDEGQEIASIRGSATKLDTNLYSSEPEVVIGIECENPIFKHSSTDLTLNDIFVGTETVDGVQYRLYDDGKSTAPRGFFMQFKYIGSLHLGEVKINVIPENGVLSTFSFNALLLPAYSVRIYSYYGDLRLQVVNVSGSVSDTSATIKQGSKWPYLGPGVTMVGIHNHINFPVTDGRHQPSYWGA